MTFFRMEMLFLIWSVPLLLLLYLYGMRRRSRILKDFATPRGLRAIAPQNAGLRRWLKAALILSAVLFGVVALAGPKYGYRWQEIERRGVDIIIALDCSKSMLAADIQPTRLDRAKREVYDLLTMLQGDRVGLVAFSGTAFLQCPLTLDYDAFNLFLNTLTPDYLPVGGTDLTRAVEVSLEAFDPKADSEKAVILITDGEHTGRGDPVKMAETAAKSRVKLFSIGVGRDEGVPVPDPKGGFKKDRSGNIVLSRLDEATLKKMAAVSQGSYVRSVAGDMDLEAIYLQEIRGKMEAATLSSGRRQVWEDRFQWVLGLGVLALLIEMFIPTVASRVVTTTLLALVLSLAAPSAARADALAEGSAAYERGDFEAALKLFIDAQLADPERAEILYNIGNAHYKKGDFEAALKHFNQALEYAGDDTKLKEKSLYNLGNTSYRMGKAEAALKHYEAALKLDPDDQQARENMAFVKKMMEQQNEKPRSDPNQDKGEQKDPSQEEKESAPNDRGNEQDADGDKDQRQAPPPAGEEESNQQDGERQPDPQEEPGESREGSRAQGGDQESQGDPDAAQQALNRLKDQPGRAMMPLYEERQVEKDW